MTVTARVSRRTAAAIAAALALAAIGVLLVVTTPWDRSPQLGPLNVAAGDSVSMNFKLGTAGSASWSQVFNYGKENAVIESIEPVGVTPGLVVEHVYAVPADRTKSGGCCTFAWPPKTKTDQRFAPKLDEIRAPKGTVVPPTAAKARGGEKGVMVLWVLRADQPGRFGMKGFAVEYTVDGKRFRRVMTNSMTICTDEREDCEFVGTYTPAEAAEL